MFEINKPPLGEGGWGLIEDLQYSVNVKYKKFHLDEISLYSSVISNGNRTEWSPILPVIIQVINKIRGLGRRRPICLVTSMITVFSQNFCSAGKGPFIGGKAKKKCMPEAHFPGEGR